MNAQQQQSQFPLHKNDVNEAPPPLLTTHTHHSPGREESGIEGECKERDEWEGMRRREGVGVCFGAGMMESEMIVGNRDSAIAEPCLSPKEVIM